MGMWTELETEHDLSYRAILEDYLVFLRREPSDLSRRKQKKQRSTGDWYIHFLIPDEERNKAYLAGEGFSHGTSLERAQVLALEKARELRGALGRKQQRMLKP
jgi:hypothetical protein